jgi:hypothetical protein
MERNPHIRDAESHLDSAESSMGIGEGAPPPEDWSTEDASAAAMMSIASSLIAIAKTLDGNMTQYFREP